jgi:hypothetical protein
LPTVNFFFPSIYHGFAITKETARVFRIVSQMKAMLMNARKVTEPEFVKNSALTFSFSFPKNVKTSLLPAHAPKNISWLDFFLSQVRV